MTVTATDEQAAKYQALFAAPRPRQVRVRLVPRILLSVLPIAGPLLIYFGILELLTFRELGANLSSIFYVAFNFFASPIMIAVSIVTFRTVRRDKKLLRDGELAVGTVTHQEFVKGRRRRKAGSRVRYRFNDPSGELFQGTGMDRSFKLRVAMKVPVFYDPQHPETNVLLSTSACEFRSASG